MILPFELFRPKKRFVIMRSFDADGDTDVPAHGVTGTGRDRPRRGAAGRTGRAFALRD